MHRHVERLDPGGGLVGLHLFGSSVCGGLRPDSDLDLLLLTRHPLSAGDRRALVGFLLQHSGRRATVAAGRPLELTSLALDDVVPWRYPPVCDLLYGEWLRDDVRDDDLPGRRPHPDLAVVLTTARQHSTCLAGPPLRDVVPEVPAGDLRAAIHDSLDPLLADLEGDERNVLLTLARMVVTLETGRIVPKDEAAALVLPGLEPAARSLLSLAVRGYLGQAVDEWDGRMQETSRAAQALADQVRRHRD